MIHYTPEGAFIKLGLNFSFTPGGFRIMWAWYDFATHNAVTYRFRLRIGKGQNFIWSVNRFNVISDHLMRHDLELVQREVLHDLRSVEAAEKRTNEPLSIIKPL